MNLPCNSVIHLRRCPIFKTIQPRISGAVFTKRKKRLYIPRNVKTAVPRANKPSNWGKKLPFKAGTNTAKPYSKKNRIMHQPEIVLGIFIFSLSFGK